MAEIKQKYRDIADRMITNEKQLKRYQKRYEQMSRLYYELPESLRRWAWVRPVVSTAPYDAIRGTVRALSNLDEAIDIHPMTVLKASRAPIDSERSKKEANVWEDVLKYNLARASGRRKSLREDIIWSIGVYDIAIGYMMHVPTQLDLVGAKGNRRDAAISYGDWALRMMDPKIVYVEWSDFMPERFLLVTVKTAKQIMDFWHDKAAYVEEQVNKSGPNSRAERLQDKWIEYEMIDHDNGRTVWVAQGETIDLEKGGHTLLEPQPWMHIVKNGKKTDDQVPFLPIVCSSGGTSVDSAPEHMLKPILYPVLMTEQWATTNIAGTIMMSQQIATASSTTDVYKGPGADNIEEDWEGPRRRIDLTPYQEYQQIKDSDMDAGLREVFDRLESAVQRATVAEVLVTARPISGEQAFASYNLQVQQALAALGGVRATGQNFIKQACEKMLLISHYGGHNITGIAGKQERVINSEHIVPENIRIKVELKADVPADRVQRVTSATQLAQVMQYPMSRILPMLGETDPEGAMNEYYWEQLKRTYFESRLQNMMREVSGEMDEQIQALAMQMAEDMLAGGGGAPPPEGGGPGPNGRGEGFVEPPTDPSRGEMPFAMVNPEGNTQEGATGRAGRIEGQETPIPAIGDQGLAP